MRRYARHATDGYPLNQQRIIPPILCAGSDQPASGDPVDDGTILCPACQRWIEVVVDNSEVDREREEIIAEVEAIKGPVTKDKIVSTIRARKGGR